MRSNRIILACLALLTLIAALVTLAAWHRFRNFDPRFDQAGNAVISRQLAEATHILPRHDPASPSSFAMRLEADRRSFLRPIGRSYKVEPIVLLDATSLLANAFAMRIFGLTYSVTIFASILASSLTAFVVFAWCYALLPELSPGIRNVCSLLAGTVLLLGSYHFYFSPWGAHNFAVFFLTLTLFAADLALRRWATGISRLRLAFLLVALIGALYSYSTNFLLLVLAVPSSIAFMPRLSLRKRALAAAFVVVAVLIALPVLVTLFPPPLATEPDPHPLLTAWHSALGWFAAGVGYYSLPGFLLGVAGAGLLVTRRKTNVVAVTLFAHWLLWTFLRSFTWNMTATGLRTFTYILPLFALGAGIALGFAFQVRRRSLAIGLVSVILVYHIGLQLILIRDQAKFAQRIPLFAGLFFFEQGKVRAWVQAIDATVPAGATLLTGDAEIDSSFEALSRRADLADQQLPPLDTMERHRAQGDLSAYLSRSRKQFIPCSDLYVIAGKGMEGDISELIQHLDTPCGSVEVKAFEDFGFPSDHRIVRRITLYKVVPAAQRFRPLKIDSGTSLMMVMMGHQKNGT